MNRCVDDLAPARSDALPARIDGEWLRAPTRLAETPAGLVAVCMGCEPGGVHEVHHPGSDARALTADFLRLRTRDDALSFQARRGMVDPVRLGTGTPNPMHRGAGTAQLVDHVLFSAGNARYQAEHAVRAVTAGPATEADRRQAYAGLIATLDRMETCFAPIDDPTVVRLLPRSLRQVVGFTLLAMFRGGLPPGCRICGMPMPDKNGPGRPRLYCSTTCQGRASYLARARSQPPRRSRSCPPADPRNATRGGIDPVLKRFLWRLQLWLY